MTLTALSRATKLPESTCFRLLATLEQEGFVERANDGTGRFQIGLEMFHIGSVVLDRLGIDHHVLTFMEELAHETGETVNLGTLHGFNVLYLQKVESSQTLRASLTVGSASVPAHCSGNGKVLLAYLAEPTLAALLQNRQLERFGPHTITQADMLTTELRRVRKQGYAIDDLEYAPDIRSVAAPVRDHRDDVVAAVAVAGPASRLSLERTRSLVPGVMETATRISSRLGYHP